MTNGRAQDGCRRGLGVAAGLSPLGFVANSGHEGRGYTDTEKIDSLEN